MTEAQRDTLRSKLKSSYDRASFEVVDAEVIPELEELSDDEAAKLKNVGYGFFDLRGFTSWSNEKRDRSVFKVLQPTLAALTRVVRMHKGTVEKPTGDGLMFIIGANETDAEKVATRTLQCAQDMVDAMDTVVNPFMKTKRHIDDPFEWGIGVEMGHALIAKVGIRNHDFLTSIARAANFASKLEDEAGAGTILAGETLYDKAPKVVQDRLNLYGTVHDRLAYELELEFDSDGHPMTLAKAMSAEQVTRFGLRDWLLGGTIPTQAFSGNNGTKSHRWYGDDE